ncbi:(2E,6E)-farnesyl diphosphate synthase [hydrothermal vent metagenome]|uniref:(2E,6E)-farnesyl diphosphate synthase n=1 Tax=hydrothermal vent metagenome TaxID=652676 RepID=A0A3B0YMU9_9ZZZZ
MTEQPFYDEIQPWLDRIEKTMDHWLPKASMHPSHLHQAMRYAALGGGKRIRPILCYATGSALDINLDRLDSIACSIEFIHSYSLVHDDLPAMDDDDLRRGRPTCHKAYDEATAILAGDALQALSFYMLTHDKNMQADAQSRIQMIEILAHACGSRGMAGGQAIDLASVGKSLNIADLEDMHIHKTGALIRASVTLAALCDKELDPTTYTNLDHYAKCVGLAFQIRDDILDEEGDPDTMGKAQGMDRALNKPTYPSIVGMSDAKQRAKDLHAEALDSLSGLDHKADCLRKITTYIIDRIN